MRKQQQVEIQPTSDNSTAINMLGFAGLAGLGWFFFAKDDTKEISTTNKAGSATSQAPNPATTVQTEQPQATPIIGAGRVLTIKGTGVRIRYKPTTATDAILSLNTGEFIGYATGVEIEFGAITFVKFKAEPQSSLAKQKLVRGGFYYVAKQYVKDSAQNWFNAPGQF